MCPLLEPFQQLLKLLILLVAVSQISTFPFDHKTVMKMLFGNVNALLKLELVKQADEKYMSDVEKLI